jgi:hypothetical protein
MIDAHASATQPEGRYKLNPLQVQGILWENLRLQKGPQP